MSKEELANLGETVASGRHYPRLNTTSDQDLPPSYDQVFHPNVHPRPDQFQNEYPPMYGLCAVDFAADSPSSRFPSLVAKANQWLTQHPEFDVKSCETLAFRSNAGVADTSKVTFTGDAFMHCLRLWLIPRSNPNSLPTVINYFNTAPKLLSTDNKTNPIFEDMKTLLAKLNSIINLSPVPGRLIYVDCVSVPFYGAKHVLDCIDPDKLLLVDCAVHVTILRTFYIIGPPTQQIVGITDFHPRLINPTSRNHEPFSDLVQQVATWFEGGGQQICSIKTFTKTLEEEFTSCKVVSLRVISLKPMPGSLNQSPPPPNYFRGPLMSKTFLPVQLTTKEHFKNWNQPPQFETMQQTIMRINNWAKENSVTAVTAETLAIQMYPHYTDVHGPQSTDVNPSTDNNLIWMIRAYVDGVYPDPPISMCPISYRGWTSKPVEEGKTIPPAIVDEKNCLLM